MTDILLLAILLPVFGFGMLNPVIAFCTYIWLDLVMPQQVTYGIASGLPLSMLAAMVCLASLGINVSKLSAPRSYFIPFLLLFFAMWITFTTQNAMFQKPAWEKWDWAFKTLLATFLMVFVFRTRRDIELLIMTLLVSISYFAIALGTKSALGGAGYGRTLIPGQVNFGLFESSTLSAVAACFIPLVLFIKKYACMIPEKLHSKQFIWFGFCALLLATIMGTHARTGIICLVNLFLVGFILSKRKFAILLGVAVFGVIFLFIASDDWIARMATMKNAGEEGSAVGRLVVWQWTIDFASRNFFGGGFHAYLANEGMLGTFGNYTGTFNKAKAFHSIYFEVLGEHGYVGLVCFLLILLISLSKLFFMFLNTRKHEDGWFSNSAFAAFVGLSTLMVGASFIAIAFRPYLYYFVLLAIILEKNYHEFRKSSA